MKTKKKVLIFVPEFPRLTETFIQREISKLIELGNLDIKVFSLKKASGGLFDNVTSHVIYKRLDFLSLFKGLCFFLFRYPGRFIRAKLFIMGAESGENVRYNFFSKAALFVKSIGYAYLFSQEQPDHIHANFMTWPSTMAMISSKLLNIPYSISAHAKDVMVEGEFFKSKVETAEFISICNRFAFASCIEQSGKEDPKNVLLQYHGIEPERAFDVEKEVEKPEVPLLFNGGSRLVEKKGQKYLIKAAKILEEKGYDFELHIAGPGPLYDELFAQIKDLGLTDKVFIHGEGKGVPFDTVVSFLKASDVVVQSNINTGSGDADGVPTFVIESALMGKPIVSTDAGSITDLIQDKKTGIVVEQRNVEALAGGIEKILNDKDLAEKLGREAKAKAESMFDLEKNVKELEALLLQDHS
jgi:glycosyltransferase involved in cell wall biosynthesis